MNSVYPSDVPPSVELPPDRRIGLRSQPHPHCPTCRGEGRVAHENLEDRLFGVPGSWTIRACVRPTCGTLWLDPMPLEEDLAHAYSSYYTHDVAPRRHAMRRLYEQVRLGHYARRFGYRIHDPIGWKRAASLVFELIPSRREALDMSVMYLSPRRDGRCLDVGCGDGARVEILADLGWIAEGVDTDPAAVDKARERGVAVRLGTLDQQGFADGSFDVVFASHVIEHVPHPAELIGECHRILATGGQLVLVTPNALSLGHRKLGDRWRGLEPPRHLQIFTPDSLATVARQAGFAAPEVRTIARMAETIHRQSGRPRNPQSAFAGLRSRAEALAFEVEERRSLKRERWAGEEIVLTVRR